MPGRCKDDHVFDGFRSTSLMSVRYACVSAMYYVAVSRPVTALQLSVAHDSLGAVNIVTPFGRSASGGQCGEASAVVVPAGAGLVASPPC